MVSAADGRDMPDLDLLEDAPAPPRRRGRFWPRFERLALLALAVAAAAHFRAFPEDLRYWLGVGGEAQRRLSGLTSPAPATHPPTPSPPPSPTAAATATPTSPLPPEPGPPAGERSESPRPSPADFPSLGAPTSPVPPPADAAADSAEPPSSAEKPVDTSPSVPVPKIPEPTPTPPSPAASLGTEDNPPPTAAVVTPKTTAPARAPEKAAVPTPTPSAPTLPRSERPPGPPSGKPPSVAWLSVGFEHHLASGTLELWVDGKRVANEALDGRVTRKLLGFELRAGSVQQTLALEPGRHEVRVRLRSGDDDRTARSSATFRSGATRRLEVKAPRLRGGLTLEWK